ncbi:hypothetical protein PMAYCL1PPCAC_20730, partial [Pristionchus mayeri]
QSLASQTPFFDRLFFGDFMERNMSEITIGEVKYDEFSNIMKMIYCSDGASLTGKNMHRMLQLADRFELKIVEDRMIAFLLLTPSLSIHEKLVIADQYNLPVLR